MEYERYDKIWLALVDIRAIDGHNFAELIDTSDTSSESHDEYIGACGNVLVKSNNIREALTIIELGLKELNFKAIYVDKIENVIGLIKDNALNEDVIQEAKMLVDSDFVFLISGKLFPYSEE